jgi:hypothetical protein
MLNFYVISLKKYRTLSLLVPPNDTGRDEKGTRYFFLMPGQEPIELTANLSPTSQLYVGCACELGTLEHYLDK